MKLQLFASVALVAAAVLWGAPAGTAAVDGASGLDAVDSYLHERTAATRTPGVAYAVVTPDGIARAGAWGRDGDGRAVTRDTPFLWGSIAKPVTATAVLTLVEAGEIDLDRPVRAYLPSFTLADRADAAKITVRHLLEQTSGIPEGTGITDRFDRRADPYAEAVADLAGVTPLFAPGTRHEYTSANYVVLGAIVEAVTGRPYAAYLREHVLGPLGMGGAITSPEEAGGVLPGGHGYLFGRPVGLGAHYDRTGASYGYLGGTVDDLAHFAMAQLNGGRYGTARVLTPASVALMQRGAVPVGGTQRYGLGWRDDTRNADLGTRTVWHGGAAPGYQAMIVLLPDLGRGIVVLQNVYGVFQDWELAAAALGAARILAGGRPATVSADPTYPMLLAVLVVTLLACVALLGRCAYRLVRAPARPRRPGRVVAGAAAQAGGGLALALLAAVVLPGAFDASLRIARLYEPDVGLLLTAVTATALLLAALSPVDAWLGLRRARPAAVRPRR